MVLLSHLHWHEKNLRAMERVPEVLSSLVRRRVPHCPPQVQLSGADGCSRLSSPLSLGSVRGGPRVSWDMAAS